jgi:hypothetical protein
MDVLGRDAWFSRFTIVAYRFDRRAGLFEAVPAE